MNWCESVIVEEEIRSALESPMWSDIRCSLRFHKPVLIFEKKRVIQCTSSVNL